MQKIQFYLVPNRITVTTDMAGFTTEFRKVYQRTIKLYKGIDNTLQFEVRASDQQRQNVVGSQIALQFYDSTRKELFTVTGSAITSMPGMLQATIPAASIADISPQDLNVVAKLVNGDTESVLYGDSQFGLATTCQLLDGYNTITESVDEALVFNYEHDRKSYTSEIVQVGSGINDPATRDMTVELVGDFVGIIHVEVTKDKSTAIGNKWTRLEDWDLEVDAPTKTYTNADWRFVRFVHDGAGPGFGATFNIVLTDGEYDLVSVIMRGQDYQIGDQLRILGSQLGGNDGVNDLVITVQNVNTYPLGSLNTITGITWAGTGVGTGYYRNIPSNRVSSFKTVDKIIVRS